VDDFFGTSFMESQPPPRAPRQQEEEPAFASTDPFDPFSSLNNYEPPGNNAVGEDVVGETRGMGGEGHHNTSESPLFEAIFGEVEDHDIGEEDSGGDSAEYEPVIAAELSRISNESSHHDEPAPGGISNEEERNAYEEVEIPPTPVSLGCNTKTVDSVYSYLAHYFQLCITSIFLYHTEGS
jgi:hypothetical protein